MFKKNKPKKKVKFIDPLFLSLPIEIWMTIISYASAKEVLCLCMVSKASNFLMQHEEIQGEYIVPYQGVPTYLFREIQVNPKDIPDLVQFKLVGSAEDSTMRSSRGLFYFNIVSPPPPPEYIPCILSPVEILYNNKQKLSFFDAQGALDFQHLLKYSRSSKPTVIIIYPSSISELEEIVPKFVPLTRNEIMVVCSQARHILDKALELKCKALIINKALSINECQFILKQCIALISNHMRVNNHQNDQGHQKSCLLM